MKVIIIITMVLKNIKGLFSKYNNLIKNFSYLSVLEIIKLCLPFVTLPYLLRVLGSESYGLVAFALAFVAYFTIFINLGLDISAVRDVSVERDNKIKLNEIVSSVLLLKSLLFLLSFTIVLLLVLFVPFFKEHKLLYLFSITTSLSEILFPIWFFLGIEKMKYITVVKFTTTVIYTLAVFIVINSPEDYYWVPLLKGIGVLFGGFTSLFFLFKKEKIKIYYPSIAMLITYAKASFPFFLSRVSVVINGSLAKIVAGVFLGMEKVAIYDLADKLISAGKIPLQTLNSVVYPHIAKTKDKKFVKKIFWVMIAISTVIAFFISLFAEPIVILFSGKEMLESISILRLLSINIIFCGITYYIGSPVLVSFGYVKPFNNSVIYSTLFLFILYVSFYLLGMFSLYIFVLAVLLVELFIVFYRMYYCLKYELIKF